MNIEKINEIQRLTHEICPTLNLFDGYSMKPFDGKAPETMFWGIVNNLYYIFKDCDNFQISIGLNDSNLSENKSQPKEKNLFMLFYKKRIISREEYNMVSDFFRQVSDFRSWYCHNTNLEYCCTKDTVSRIELFFTSFFGDEETSPKSFLETKSRHWQKLNTYMKGKGNAYLDLLKKSLQIVNESVPNKRERIVESWMKVYSFGLLCNNELIRNIAQDYAVLKTLNVFGTINEKAVELERRNIDRLIRERLSHYDILNVIKNTKRMNPSGYIILKDAVRNIIGEEAQLID